MIYPTLEINSDGTNSINFIDTEFDSNPFLSMSNDVDNKDTPCVFFTLLTAFINQYNCGYDDAIDDGAFGEEDLFI